MRHKPLEIKFSTLLLKATSWVVIGAFLLNTVGLDLAWALEDTAFRPVRGPEARGLVGHFQPRPGLNAGTILTKAPYLFQPGANPNPALGMAVKTSPARPSLRPSVDSGLPQEGLRPPFGRSSPASIRGEFIESAKESVAEARGRILEIGEIIQHVLVDEDAIKDIAEKCHEELFEYWVSAHNSDSARFDTLDDLNHVRRLCGNHVTALRYHLSQVSIKPDDVSQDIISTMLKYLNEIEGTIDRFEHIFNYKRYNLIPLLEEEVTAADKAYRPLCWYLARAECTPIRVDIEDIEAPIFLMNRGYKIKRSPKNKFCELVLPKKPAQSQTSPAATEAERPYEHPLGPDWHIEPTRASMLSTLDRLIEWLISKNYENTKLLKAYQLALKHAEFSPEKGFVYSKEPGIKNPYTGLPQISVSAPTLYNGLRKCIPDVHDLIMYTMFLPREAKGAALGAAIHDSINQGHENLITVITDRAINLFESHIQGIVNENPQFRGDRKQAVLHLLENLDKYPQLVKFLTDNRDSIIGFAADKMARETIEGIEHAKALIWAAGKNLFDPEKTKIAKRRHILFVSSGAEDNKILDVELQEIGRNDFGYWLRGNLNKVRNNDVARCLTFLMLQQILSFLESGEGFDPRYAQTIMSRDALPEEAFRAPSAVLLEPVRERIAALEGRIARTLAEQSYGVELDPSIDDLLAQVNELGPPLEREQLEYILNEVFGKDVFPMHYLGMETSPDFSAIEVWLTIRNYSFVTRMQIIPMVHYLRGAEIAKTSPAETDEERIVEELCRFGEATITAIGGEEFVFKFSSIKPDVRGAEEDLVIDIFVKKEDVDEFIGYAHATITEGMDWEKLMLICYPLYTNQLIPHKNGLLSSGAIQISDEYQKRGIRRTALSLLLHIAQRKKVNRAMADLVKQERITTYLEIGFKLIGRIGRHVDERGECLEFLLDPRERKVAFPVVGIDPARTSPLEEPYRLDLYRFNNVKWISSVNRLKMYEYKVVPLHSDEKLIEVDLFSSGEKCGGYKFLPGRNELAHLYVENEHVEKGAMHILLEDLRERIREAKFNSAVKERLTGRVTEVSGTVEEHIKALELALDLAAEVRIFDGAANAGQRYRRRLEYIEGLTPA